MTALFFILF